MFVHRNRHPHGRPLTGREIVRAQGPSWAADRARIIESLLDFRGALEPPALGRACRRAEHLHRRDIRRALPIPRLFWRAACAACTLTAVCVCFCCRIAALARWACLQHPGRRWGARIHEDRRHTRRPHRGPRVPRWRIARHGRAPAAHEAQRAYYRSPSTPPWQHLRACACCARYARSR